MDTFIDAVKAIYDWQHGSDSFNAHLCFLWRKADASNKRRLATMWPQLALAFEAWEKADDYGMQLFRDVGITPAG